MLIDEESFKGTTDTEQGVDNLTEELDNNDAKLPESPSKSGELAMRVMKKGDGKLGSFSRRVINCQGKKLRIHIPVTNPTRTFSAITYLLWDDLKNQSSKKCGPEGNKFHINKKKLHHAEKMIRGAFVELYKGLGYLKTYRYELYYHFSIFLPFSMTNG